MKQNKQNNDQHSDFFEKLRVPYEKSKEQVWLEMMDEMEQSSPKTKTRTIQLFYWAAAAVVVLFLGLGSFLRFYKVQLHCPYGQHQTIDLPDGSLASLNAGTRLEYYPYWWRFARKLKLEGEAYFEVEKGNQFKVISSQGTTSVLGTSFNIYARGKDYKVHCYSGKVHVESKTGEEQLLEMHQLALITPDGLIKQEEKEKVETAIAWRQNHFYFTAVPLQEVMYEMERQYDIQIDLQSGIEGTYTGDFKRGSSILKTLETICIPFGLKVEKVSGNRFKIYR